MKLLLALALGAALLTFTACGREETTGTNGELTTVRVSEVTRYILCRT
jgi:hypothetical protein